jgi:TatD DNase family protein
LSLVDAHCHLDLYDDYDGVVTESIANDVRVLAVTTTPLAFEGNLSKANGANEIIVALGLHPQMVGSTYADLDLFMRLLGRTAVVGEVGLDASRDFYKSLGSQVEVFSKIVSACASAGGKALSVHSLRAARQVLSLIESNDAACRNRYAFHWFTGSPSEARSAVLHGHFFSVNTAMMRSARLRAMIASIPISQILTETDGPFLKNDSNPATPSTVGVVVKDLASLFGTSYEAAEKAIDQNFDRFLAKC